MLRKDKPSKKAWWPIFVSAQWATHSRFTLQSPVSKAVGSCWSSALSTPRHSKRESVWAGTFFCDTSAATPSTGRRCSQNIAKNACVQLAQNENKAQRSHQANGSAATRTGCVASAQNIMQMLEPPWQCNVCKLRHVEANFPEKHRQRQCSFFRVCLTCEMKKPCFKCGVAKPEAEFGPAAWKARNADRRCCRECTTKQRGCWQCSQCSERKPRAEFTAWQQSRKHTQDGTQVCNACTAFAFVCRLAHRTNQRLARLRQRESRQRHEAILAQTFARRFRKSTRLGKRRWEQTETRTGVAHSSTQQLAVEPDTATPRVYTYLCPHCAKSVQSTVATGQVYHRRGDGCGKKFRVANGLLAGRTLAHTCPTCGTVVHSTKASGQIQITHRTPNGKQCRTDRWPVQNWSQTEPSPNNRTLRARHAETAGPWRTDRACRPPPSVPNVAFCTYKKTNSLSCLPAAKAQTRRARHTETAGPWGTDRACGPGPPLPNVAFWTYKKASCLTCLPAAKAHTRRDCHAKTTGSWGTDRACGPRPPRPVFQPPRLTQGALATPKQQGPEGRTGPAGHGPPLPNVAFWTYKKTSRLT